MVTPRQCVYTITHTLISQRTIEWGEGQQMFQGAGTEEKPRGDTEEVVATDVGIPVLLRFPAQVQNRLPAFWM